MCGVCVCSTARGDGCTAPIGTCRVVLELAGTRSYGQGACATTHVVANSCPSVYMRCINGAARRRRTVGFRVVTLLSIPSPGDPFIINSGPIHARWYGLLLALGVR